MERTIPYMLEQASHAFGDRGYLFKKNDSGWQGYSFSQVRQLARAFASCLHARGWAGPLAIVAEGRPSWVIAELGIFMLRGFSVPLSYRLSAEEIAFRLNHSQSKLVVCSKNSVEKIAQSLKTVKHGCRVIYLDDDGPELNALKALLNQNPKIELFFYHDLILEGTTHIDNPIHLKELEAIEDACDPDDVATVSYTSGTTGDPKGIMLTQGNYYANVRDSLAGFAIPVGIRLLNILPIDHSYAHTIALYVALIQELGIYFVDARGGPMGILRNIPLNIKEVKPYLILTVPALTANFRQRIIQSVEQKGGFVAALFRAGLNARIKANGTVWRKGPWLGRLVWFWPWLLADLLIFSKIRREFGGHLRCISGGAHQDLKQQEFFKAIGIVVYQGYGLTEAGPVVSTNNALRHKLGTCGTVLPNVECRIVGEDGRDLPPGQKGQVVVRGGNIMKGYLHNEVATKAAVRDGWLYSGDLGYVDEDGFLVVAGREKALLITADGEKYSPEDIEHAIVSCSEFIGQCILWCDHKQWVSALITLRDEELRSHISLHKLTDPDQVLAMLINDFNRYIQDSSYKDRFPIQWRPTSFVIVDQVFSEADGLVNSTLKLVRYKIVQKYGELIDYQYTPEGGGFRNARNQKAASGLLLR